MQEIGDKEQRLRQEEGSLEETELEQKSLEAKRNALNDERKEMWRAENEAENSISKIHGNRQKAEKKVKTTPTYATHEGWAFILIRA